MVGARRTFPISSDEAWKLVTSEKGISAWLGNLPGFNTEQGTAFRLTDDTHGEVTTFIPGSHIRLTWQPKGYARPSIIQVRAIPNGKKTTIAFHQEQLPDATTRSERGKYFRRALDELGEFIRKS